MITVAPSSTPRRTTSRGTPCALSWDPDWIAQVEAREQSIDRRICGARTLGGRPCPLPSDHPSGRCRHHGGFPLTGAPPNNRNAVVHGLYSRRLAIVGPHNPDWQSSPFGGGAPDQGRSITQLPEADRAVCPLEQAEYNAVVTDVMKRTCANPENAFGLHLAHQVALLTVMVSRAARALATKPFTDKVEKSSEDGYMGYEKPSAALLAFERLSRELRRWIDLVERNYPVVAPNSATNLEHELRTEYDTRHDPDGHAALEASRSLADEDFANQKTKQLYWVNKENPHYNENFERRYGIEPGPAALETIIQKMLAGVLPLPPRQTPRLPVPPTTG